MILLIDNYDSFTFNLFQYLGELGEEVIVKRNDQITLEEIKRLAPEGIVLSPGPGRPEDAGICTEIIKAFYKDTPILGICLGHQAIGKAFGAKIEKARQIMHGKVSKVTHNGSHLFQYLSQPLDVMRYHSLVIKNGSLPGFIKVLAKSMDDQEIMAIKHEHHPVYGLQFHPESVGTLSGMSILKNFLNELKGDRRNEHVS